MCQADGSRFGVPQFHPATLQLRILHSGVRVGVVCGIFGAVVLNLHGLARATQGLDIFASPTDGNSSRLRSALEIVVNDPHIDEITVEVSPWGLPF
jgi:hypothetical protein